MSVRKVRNKKNTQNIIIISLLAVFLFFIIIGIALLLFQNNKGKSNSSEEIVNSEEYNYEKTVYYEISKKVMINLKEQTGEYNFYLGKDNICMVKVEIFDGDGNKISESDYIYPNENDQQIQFETENITKKTNPEGYALITAYDMSSMESVGSKEEKIRLNFKN